MKKLISFCLYGNDPIYIKGALLNAKASKKVFKDWELRFYISDEIKSDVEKELLNSGCKTIKMKRRALSDFMFYRFLPIQEPFYDAVIVRDVDSILDERDEWTVQEWLESGCSFHIIRDHPNHAFYILGGMFGYRPKSKKIINLNNLIANWKDFDKYGADQEFLANRIYPLIRNDVYIHSDFVAFGDESVKSIKVKRNGLSWIGKRYINEKKINEEILKQTIPRGLIRFPLLEFNLSINKNEYKNSKFVVLKGAEGFGDRLQCLTQAISYASQTQRILVVDWRDEHWSHDPLLKFSEYFEIKGVKNIEFNCFIKFFIENKKSLKVFPEAWGDVMADPNFISLISQRAYKLPEKGKIINEISLGIKNDFQEDIVVYPGKGIRNSNYFLLNCLNPSEKMGKKILEFAYKNFLYHKSYDVIHLRGGSKKWLGGRVADNSPVKDQHDQWADAYDYMNPIWNIYKSLNPSLPLYLISDSSKLINFWQQKYNCGLAIPNVASKKLRECGIHKLRPEDLKGINSPIKKEINYECIRDFIIMLNSNFLIGDDVSLFSKGAFETKKFGIFFIKFPVKPSTFRI